MLSLKARSITPYTAGEQPKERLFIKLNTNENPYPPSGNVKKVFENFDTSVLRLYPDPESTELKKAIARYENVKPENIFVGNGSDEVLAHAFAALFDHCLPLKFADVTYSFYEVFAALYDLPFTKKPLSDDFTLIEKDYFGDCNAVIANPNAPTGIPLSQEQIEAILSSCAGNVIVDEAYVDFAEKGASCVPMIDKYQNLLVVKTFSKSYSLAGIRCGYAVGCEELIRGLDTIKNSFNSYPLDAVCQKVCKAAIEDAEYYRAAAQRVVATRERTRQQLLAQGYQVLPSQANFLFVKSSAGGEELYTYLRQNGILVRYFKKPRIDSFVRITVGTDAEMDALTAACQKFNQTK